MMSNISFHVEACSPSLDNLGRNDLVYMNTPPIHGLMQVADIEEPGIYENVLCRKITLNEMCFMPRVNDETIVS